MARQITDEAERLIKQWEGKRLTAYRDGGGVLTIGYGHTGPDVRPSLTITDAQADELFRRDIARFEEIVDKAVKVPLTDNQFGALVSFAYNVGEGDPKNPKSRPGFLTSTLLRKLNQGDYSAVPKELARWVHDNGKVVPGLVNRRAAEAGLWVKGSFVSSSTVPVSPAPVALLTKENATWGAGILTSILSAVAQPGPVQWALAGIMVAAFGLGVWWFLARRKEQAA